MAARGASKTIAIALMVSLTLNVLLLAALISYEKRYLLKIEELKRANEELTRLYNQVSEENRKLREELETLKGALQNIGTYNYPEFKGETLEEYESIPIVGVYAKPRGFFEYEYEGMVMKAYAKLMPGTGKIFIATTPKIGIDLQRAAEAAFKAALKHAHMNASLDVVLVISANSTVNVVDGPSAGGALAVLLTAMLENITLRRDVVMTGTIDEQGHIGPVGGIYAKAVAAARYGAKIFIVPRGQAQILVTVPHKRQIGAVTIITYEYVKKDLEKQLQEEGYNIKVVEASTLDEALKYFMLKA